MLSIGETQINYSSIKQEISQPKWNETFYFFINTIETEIFVCKILNEKDDSVLGTIEIPITQLIQEDDLILEKRFEMISNNPILSGTIPKVFLKLRLKVRFLSLINYLINATFFN